MADETKETNQKLEENKTPKMDKSRMHLAPDPEAQDKPRSAKDPVNWEAFGINTEAHGKKSPRKIVTDNPPDDVPSRDVPKLPPQVINHDDKGNTTGQHSSNDERFNDADLKETAENESSVDNTTPKKTIDDPSVKPGEGEDAKKSETPDDKKPENKATPAVAPLNQTANKTSQAVPVSPNKTAQVKKSTSDDPSLKVR